MKRSAILAALGLAVLGLTPGSAWAQRGRHSGTVSTPYGTFSASEMREAGGDPTMASQMRMQKQEMQFQQMQFKQQQAYMQQQAKQADFLKKHPEAAKALNPPAKLGTATKKAAKKGKGKEKDQDKDKDKDKEKDKPADSTAAAATGKKAG